LVTLREALKLPKLAGKSAILDGVILAGGFEAEQLVGGDAEDLADLDDYLGVEAELAALIVGDHGLDRSDPFGELGLGEALLTAQTRQANTMCFGFGC
jgi:hypothetical protein